MFGIAVGVGVLSYSAFFYGFYYVRKAPITWLDCVAPSRRANTYQLIMSAGSSASQPGSQGGGAVQSGATVPAGAAQAAFPGQVINPT